MPEISPEEQEWARVVTQQLLELRSRVLDLEHRRRMAPKPAGFVDGLVIGALFVALAAAALEVFRG